MVRPLTARARLGGWRRRCAAAALGTLVFAAVAGGAAGPAAAQQRIACLWDALSPLLQIRLELAARLDEGLPKSVVDRIGADGIQSLLNDCGLDSSPASLAVMSRYWITRAELEVGRAELAALDTPVDAAEDALSITAPPAKRRTLAEEIMAGAEGEAGPAIFTAISVLEGAMDGLTDAQRRRLALYFTALILADGLAAGALPPTADLPPDGFSLSAPPGADRPPE